MRPIVSTGGNPVAGMPLRPTPLKPASTTLLEIAVLQQRLITAGLVRVGPARMMVTTAAATVAIGVPVAAGASTGLTLPPEDYLPVYEQAAAEAECEIRWPLLAGIAGVVSNHTQPLSAQTPTPVDLTPSRAAGDADITDSGILDAPHLSSSTRAEAAATGDDPDLGGVDAEAIAEALAAAFPLPPNTNTVVGPVLDGAGGRLSISDTDRGVLDNDMAWDRAVGPFQFLPATWAAYGIDGDSDAILNPQNLADAAGSAANMLCIHADGTDLVPALSLFLGGPERIDAVYGHAEEVHVFWQSLQPVESSAGVEVAGVTVEPSPQAGDVATVRVGGVTVAARIEGQTVAMFEAAAADGIVLTGWGWRSHQRQIELRAAHCADVWLTPSSDCSPPTATPGNSMHEIGEAIDFYTTTPGGVQHALDRESPVFLWLVERAGEFGFTNLPSEPWHWSTSGH